ncbi:NUDIX domain-containing protein [Acrocarpospora sp. B8E8]|uniref:NUDIX domain-containing protein n=1 Tax=Acrocarpospora sp. B8E8 TaxID=3153572 RepID=UPI00325C63FD
MGNTTWTHPDVLDRGVREGWAESELDPARIDWAERRGGAAFPFPLVDGRPVNPLAPTGIRFGRGELGHWGEKQAADAIVTAWLAGVRHLLMVERGDGHGWAVPGGFLDPDEAPLAAVVRELEEEAGLVLPGAVWRVLPVRLVPDPRATDEAWMVTWPATTDLGEVGELPAVAGADDARRAEWVRADSYDGLVAELDAVHRGRVFPAHAAMLAELLG